MQDLESVASAFLEIFDTRRLSRTVEPLVSLSIDEAYQAQGLFLDARTARGERAIGYKVGCTSSAIRRQFGLAEPICGQVMEPFVYWGETELCWDDFCQPAVEPEVVLLIGRDVRDEVGEDDRLESVIDSVSPGLELHHFRFWFGEPSVQELIASNGIHAGLVIGETKVKPEEIDWEMEGVGLFKNGRVKASGIVAEIMGGPLTSLRWLINHLVRQGKGLKAGEVVIPGSAVELVSVDRGDEIVSRFTHAGEVHTRFV